MTHANAIKASLQGSREDQLEAIGAVSDALDFDLLAHHELDSVATALVETITTVSDQSVREPALDALSNLTSGTFFLKLDWKSVLALLHVLPANELEFLISIIGTSGKPEFADFLRPFSTHPREFIRDAARDAILQLEMVREKPIRSGVEGDSDGREQRDRSD